MKTLSILALSFIVLNEIRGILMAAPVLNDAMDGEISLSGLAWLFVIGASVIAGHLIWRRYR